MGTVLVTGSSGSIGRAVVPGLRALGWTVRGLDLVAADDAPDAFFPGDVTDRGLLDRAVAGADAVVHLAGMPDEGPLAAEVDSHVLSTGAVLEAARQHGVQRVVLASSNHAVGRTPREGLLRIDVRPRPDTFYGVAKVAMEALGSLYVDRYGLDVVCLRIGSFGERPANRRHLATWLSPGDAVRLVQAGLTAPSPGFAVTYGVSDNTRGWWDLSAARALGYEPQDDAEAYAADVLAVPETAEDRRDDSVVGGMFVDPRYDVGYGEEQQ
jgi:uronate dehydrogenase